MLGCYRFLGFFICASFCAFILSDNILCCIFCISYNCAIFQVSNSLAFIASSPAIRYSVSACPSTNLRYSPSNVAALRRAAALRSSNSFFASALCPANSRGKRFRFQFSKSAIRLCPFVALFAKTRPKKKPANYSLFRLLLSFVGA